MSSNKIVDFPGKRRINEPDDLLESVKGELDAVLVIGWDKDGELFAASSKNLEDGGEMLWLIEQFKNNLLSGVYIADDD